MQAFHWIYRVPEIMDLNTIEGARLFELFTKW